MEHASIKLGDDQAYDQAVHSGLKECGDLTLITKDRATVEGRPGVCLTFTVQLPSGEMARAQTVVTGRLFGMMAAAMRSRYGADCDLPPRT